MNNTNDQKGRLIAILVVQFSCLIFLVVDVTLDLSGYDNENNIAENHYFELIVVISLIFSIVVIATQLQRVLNRNKRIEDQLKIASGAFQELLNQHFDEWDLTQSEKDVALLAIKGLGIAEIAEIRATKEGTIKAQLNAIYRKARVNGRPQLISIFVEELMAESLSEVA